jgi:hypothetical protein
VAFRGADDGNGSRLEQTGQRVGDRRLAHPGIVTERAPSCMLRTYPRNG